jgi:hypothetical protein
MKKLLLLVASIGLAITISAQSTVPTVSVKEVIVTANKFEENSRHVAQKVVFWALHI